MAEINQSLVRFNIKASNEKLEKVMSSFSVHLILNKSDDIISNSTTTRNLNESAALIIKHAKNKQRDNFFIIGFKNTIFLLNQTLLTSLQNNFFSNNPKLPIYFLPDTKSIFNSNIKLENEQIENDDQFNEEIKAFNEHILIFHILPKLFYSDEIFISILSCMTGYLIQDGYKKAKCRLNLGEQIIALVNESLEKRDLIKNCTEDDYIELRELGIGSSSRVELIYHLERGELFALKKRNVDENEMQILADRELRNYIEFESHPLISKFYGKVQEKNHLIINFIDGQLLSDLDKTEESGQKLKLSFEYKILVIAQIIGVLENIYHQHYIYRDLKPNNVIVNHNKVAILTDLDRMVHINDTYKNDYTCTADFNSVFMAPEIERGDISDKNDIYSLGQIIYYIMNEKMPPRGCEKTQIFEQNPNLYEIYKQCVEKKPDDRPSIRKVFAKLADIYFLPIYAFLLTEKNFKDYYDLICSNETVCRGLRSIASHLLDGKFTQIDSKKAIHFYSIASDHGDVQSHYELGCIYYKGIIKRDINLAINYFQLAAKQNHVESLFYLGQIFSDDKYIGKDIKYSIYCYTLAAKQNSSESQYKLGMLYHKDECNKNMKKSIEFLSKAAFQNKTKAQFEFGKIYLEDKNERDINKAIYYLNLASENNSIEAQFLLGMLYYEDKYIKRDIHKAISYFELASKQNDAEAQYKLGIIYSRGLYIIKDLNLSTFYFKKASEQNHSKSLNELGEYYFKHEKDINKAIHYYSLAEKQGNSNAQIKLALIYLNGKYVKRDIHKSIHYFQLAADSNNAEAQYYLAKFLFEGEYLTQDVEQSIKLYAEAAKQNYAIAQYELGKIYLLDQFVDQMKYDGIDLLIKASNQCHDASFSVGSIFHEGKLIQQDIKKAECFYKDASSFNNHYAKNNLGIIYKNGIGDQIQKNIGFAIEYFSDAIKLNDPVSMYNLAHIYIFEDMKEKIDESIDLLINSLVLEFQHSKDLLCIALIKKHGMNFAKIKQNIIEKIPASSDLPQQIWEIIENYIEIKVPFDKFYQEIKEKDYVYDYLNNFFESKNMKIEDRSNENLNISKPITSEFYDGFNDM